MVQLTVDGRKTTDELFADSEELRHGQLDAASITTEQLDAARWVIGRLIASLHDLLDRAGAHTES